MNKRIIRSRDVVFLEDQTIKDLKKETPKRIVVKDSNYDPSLAVNDNAGENTTENNDQTRTNNNPTSSSNDDREEGQDESILSDSESAEDISREEPQLRRSTRERRPSTRYNPDKYVTLIDEGEPYSYEEAMVDRHKIEWVKAMQEEMKSLYENHTYDLVELPKGRKAFRNNGCIDSRMRRITQDRGIKLVL